MNSKSSMEEWDYNWQILNLDKKYLENFVIMNKEVLIKEDLLNSLKIKLRHKVRVRFGNGLKNGDMIKTCTR